MLHKIKPSGWDNIIAASVLSQGVMTAPRTLFAAVDHKRGKAVVSEYILPYTYTNRNGETVEGGDHYGASDYLHGDNLEAQALERFAVRLNRDREAYTDHGVPVTGQPHPDNTSVPL